MSVNRGFTLFKTIISLTTIKATFGEESNLFQTETFCNNTEIFTPNKNRAIGFILGTSSLLFLNFSIFAAVIQYCNDTTTPCMNNGTCNTLVVGDMGRKCNCTEGWTGFLCESKFNSSPHNAPVLMTEEK